MHERITFIHDQNGGNGNAITQTNQRQSNGGRNNTNNTNNSIEHTFSTSKYTIKDVTEVNTMYGTKMTNKVSALFSRQRWEDCPLPNANPQLYGMGCVITDDKLDGAFSGHIDEVDCTPTWFKLTLHVSKVDIDG